MAHWLIHLMHPPDTSQNDSVTTRDASPTHQNDALIDALRAQIEQLTSQVKREQENADNWKNQATMLLTHQSEPETRKEDNTKLLFKLFGKHRPNG